MTEQKYYNYIDIGKFFAMYFVIIMHVIQDNNNLYFKIFQIGCMAYFFFASGFLFNPEKISPTSKYIFKNLKNLLIPYLICGIIGIVVIHLFPSWYGEYTKKDIFESIFILGQPIAYGVCWFLICLFEVKIAFLIIWKIVSALKNKTFITIILMIIVILLNLLAMHIIEYYKNGGQRLPLKIDSTIIATTYYIIGFLFKYLNIFMVFKNKYFSLFAFAVTRILATYIELNYLQITNICDYIFNYNYILYYINQLLGIISFVSIGNILSDVKILSYIGRNNLWTYLVHTYILWIIEEIYGFFVGATHYSIRNIYEIFFLSTITYIISILISISINSILTKKIKPKV